MVDITEIPALVAAVGVVVTRANQLEYLDWWEQKLQQSGAESG
jgi:hypothetical protein